MSDCEIGWSELRDVERVADLAAREADELRNEFESFKIAIESALSLKRLNCKHPIEYAKDKKRWKDKYSRSGGNCTACNGVGWFYKPVDV